MKHLSQVALIAAVSCAGELLNHLIPLPIPGSIYGLILMFLLLLTHVIKVEQVKTVGDWLITLMPVMFVGPTVGLLESFDSYKDFIIPILVTIIVSTVLVMAVTGLTAQALVRLTKRKEWKKNAK